MRVSTLSVDRRVQRVIRPKVAPLEHFDVSSDNVTSVSKRYIISYVTGTDNASMKTHQPIPGPFYPVPRWRFIVTGKWRVH